LKKSELVGRLSLRENALFYRLVRPPPTVTGERSRVRESLAQPPAAAEQATRTDPVTRDCSAAASFDQN